MRILLVDDSDVVRLTLGAVLEDAGHVVIEATSLASARAHLLDEAFDLVLLDVHLGDGHGPTLIPEIRMAVPRARIAVLTGEPTQIGGADAVLVKGDDPVRLLEHLERMVASR